MRKRIIMTTTCVAATCLALVGCGSGGSNDNGVSFSFLGVFQEAVEQVAPAADTLPTADNHPGDTGRIVDLAQISAIPNDVNGDGDADGGFLGMQNNLDSESINVEGVNVKIVVPGATINPVATDFVALGIRLGPAKVAQGETATNEAFAQTFFVQPDLIAFLNQNPGLLPPKPFTMNIVMRLTGTSDSGDSFDSNEFTYTVTVVPSSVP
ncbi:MAG: hypothetical protein HY271_20715 [Deltaproteobacteria bacterium]|nr:hypothetical protein [Deltaproteobacteria bacterium]